MNGLSKTVRTAMVALIALPALAGCAAIDSAAGSTGSLNCMDSVPRSGDLNDRTRLTPISCSAPPGRAVKPNSPGESGRSAAIPSATPSTAGTGAASSDSASGSDGDGNPAAPTTGRPSVPAASLRAGQPSPAGAGSYVLWIKAENHVYLIRQGKVIRVMPTTALTWKTPPGSYEVKYKERNSASIDKGHTWVLPYFVAFWRRPTASGDIAFHQVPYDSKATSRLAQPLDTVGEDGQVSDGCARMKPADAKAIWDFTRVGTRVVVR